MSRHQYDLMHQLSPEALPRYSLLQREKRTCYPPEEARTVTENVANIKLQDILDLTISRLAMFLEEQLKSLSEDERANLRLISKWGCDGSRQALFMQPFEKSDGSDGSVFQTTFVPLLLVSDSGAEAKTIWQNPCPSSPRFCRPIRFRFVKETAEVIAEETNIIRKQIENLAVTKVSLTDGIFMVKHTMELTMVDVKVCLTNITYTQRCYICSATSTDFNNLSKMYEQEADINVFEFGLSVLHARIRFLDFVLHLSCKLPIGRYRMETEEDRTKMAETKRLIQDAFRETLGLLVDTPKSNFGNANDGNLSRRFFNEIETVSAITGVDAELLGNFRLILDLE